MITELYKISIREEACLNSLITIEGTIEEKNLKIEKSNIPEKYNQIFKQYSELAAFNIEALKRAVFFLWYSRVEPFFITGMNFENEKKSVNNVIKLLDKMIIENKLDREFKTMLNHYSNWDFLFADLSNYGNFYNYIEQNKNAEITLENINEMKDRGELGNYWKSLKKNRS